MTATTLTLALLALLLTPGPTNTLMLLSGAERGIRATLPLIPVELAAYLTTVMPLALLASLAHDDLAQYRPFVAVAAGLWVLTLALRLWRSPAEAGGKPFVGPRQVFVTTLLNPKALLIGLVLLPAHPLPSGLAIFAALVVIVALVWAALGARLPFAQGLPLMLRRAAACWLAVLSVGILANGFTS